MYKDKPTVLITIKIEHFHIIFMRQPVIFFTHFFYNGFFLYIILCQRNYKSSITVFQKKNDINNI